MLKMQQLKRSLKNSFGQVFSMWHGGQAKLKVWAERSQTNAINERVRQLFSHHFATAFLLFNELKMRDSA